MNFLWRTGKKSSIKAEGDNYFSTAKTAIGLSLRLLQPAHSIPAIGRQSKLILPQRSKALKRPDTHPLHLPEALHRCKEKCTALTCIGTPNRHLQPLFRRMKSFCNLVCRKGRYEIKRRFLRLLRRCRTAALPVSERRVLNKEKIRVSKTEPATVFAVHGWT